MKSKIMLMFSFLACILLFCQNCYAYSYKLSFQSEYDNTYSIIATDKTGYSEMVFNCWLYFIFNPYNYIIVNNLDSQISLTGNQLNKLKRIARIIDTINEQIDYCSWGEKRIKLDDMLTIQRKKLSLLLDEIFKQNDML